jgi:CRISPR-associated protein Cas8b1/Cst1 subtype I-B
MQRARILLADDHVIIIEGLRRILEDQFELVGAVTDGRALIEEAKTKKPDIILLDISMPLLNGLDAARILQKDSTRAKLIFLTMHTDSYFVKEAFRAGASGYLLKQSAGDELVVAIKHVLEGRVYISPLITEDLIPLIIESKNGSPQNDSDLTSRQRQILQLIAEGKSMKEIALLLDISVRTAESHKYEMMHNLGIKTNAELIQYAIRIGLVSI